jgi:DnaJ-class molecular chaperone
MTQTDSNYNRVMFSHGEPNYYWHLELHPSASIVDIRKAYRKLSKRYHPDTTELPANIAIGKFQQINQAYATLSNPEQRALYDLKIVSAHTFGTQASPHAHNPASKSRDWSSLTYLDASERPLSSGEIFALFILGLTILGCLLLAVLIGLIRGESTGQLQLVNKWLAKIL